ncbi:MAG: FAD-dependent 5-carboxymethylaminomethyl-2-thiouridine(34) oxidoreductase MnmC [Rubrivivax sp.]|nr:FAD-dependent 5-carboxymethylaminomethyl-2-thiouridine(34) oxidoreductase MnmC [Rubrivivax sp.]
MKTAHIEFDADGVPHAPAFGDRYHPRGGSAAQAEQVFLAGNGLPARWAGRADFTILETGFGLGQNFLATWAAWRADPARPTRLHYVAIEGHPPAPADLARALLTSPWPGLATALQTAWPPAVEGLHPVDLDERRVRLLLAWGEARPMLRALDLRADAFFLDGFAPDRNPAMWQPALMQALARRAASGATAASWTVARVVRDGLQAAGFEIERGPAAGEKRETLRARFAPRFTLRQPPPRGGGAPGRVLIVGAGLAGGWAAHALAQQGHDVTVVDRHAAPAREASGNPAGLFHPTVHADDSVHARFQRAAALLAARTLAPWVADGSVPGQVQGLLRLGPDSQPLEAMNEWLDRQGLPTSIVQALAQEAASDAAAAALTRPAWRFGPAGWVAPAALVARLLRGVAFLGGRQVAGLRRRGADWQLLDANEGVIDQAPTLVLANAADAARLWPAAGWPLGRSRGQLSQWPAPPAQAPRLRLPVAGDGYALTLPDGSLLFGATAAPGDDEAAPRIADHRFNLVRLARLTGWPAAGAQADPCALLGHVGWRAQTPDRLPLVGAVPDPHAGPPMPLQAAWMSRVPGLFVLTGLGSRGLTWGPLAGRMLAAWVGGSPMPVEAQLRDALDPGRWQLRAWRRGPPG